MTGTNQEKTKRGLTLIEVLAVLALLSLLIMMVLPLYHQSAWWIGQTRQSITADNYAYSLLEGVRAQAVVLNWSWLSSQVVRIPDDLDLGMSVPEEYEASIKVTPWPGYIGLFKVEAKVIWQDEMGAVQEKTMVTLIAGAKD